MRAYVVRREYGLKFLFLICVAWSYGISRAPKYLKALRRVLDNWSARAQFYSAKFLPHESHNDSVNVLRIIGSKRFCMVFLSDSLLITLQ